MEALAVVGALVSAFAALVCFENSHTTIWLPPDSDGGAATPHELTNSSMVSWGVTATVCAVAYALAALIAFTRGLSTKSWLPLVCLVFPAVLALWMGLTFQHPVG